MGMGVLDTGGNVMLIWLHGKKVGPYMQAMHFSFALGAFLSPIIIHSFLDNTGSTEEEEEDYQNIHYDGKAIQNSFWIMAASFVPVALYLLFFDSPSRQNEQTSSNANTLTNEYDGELQTDEQQEPRGNVRLFYGFTSRELTIISLTFILLVSTL